MKRHIILKIMVVMMVVLLTSMHVSAASKTTEFFDGALSVTDSAGKGTGDIDEYKITVSARGSEEKNDITITNEGDVGAKISFRYSVSNHTNFTIDEKSVATRDVFSRAVEPKGSINISLSTKGSIFSQKTATLTLTDITYSVLKSSSQITYMFDSSQGAVTVGGTDISSGSTITVEESGATVVATPASGAKFIAWVDENDKIISRDASYTQMSVDDCTVKALFSEDTPYFMVDNSYIVSDLNAATGKGSNIILICDGTLPAGDYVIPVGKMLLIPFDAANKLYTTVPEGVQGYTKPTVYRTLTLAKDANITVDGAISVSAKHSSSTGSVGSPYGAYGHIDMKEDSSITINSGGNLYAWGYITGSGRITAKQDATVYECFQVSDWRGGDATTKAINYKMTDANVKKVFPMSQYYVQNIEVPLTLEEGAVENGYMSVYVKLAGINGSHVPFIGPNGMFRIQSGSITKDYDENTDRLIIDVDGTLGMEALSITMKINTLGDATIDSSTYTLPVNGNITLNINEGSQVNVTQDMALLPGAVINVRKDATCKFASGVKAFIYDSEAWKYDSDAGVKGYCGPGNMVFMPVKYAPGKKYARTEADLVDAEVYVEGTVDAEAGFVYTTMGGANIHGAEGALAKIKVDKVIDRTYQATQYKEQSLLGEEYNIAYQPIDVTTAYLRNSDGTYTDPETLGDCCSAYEFLDGKWEPQTVNHTEETMPAVAPTCTEAGKTAGVKCSACGTVIKQQEEVPALGHTYGDWTKADDTNHSKTCGCGDVISEAHGWDAGVITTPANCKATGVKTFTCSECNGTKTQVIPIDEDGHTFVGFKCSLCGCEKIVTSTTYTVNGESLLINTSLISEVPADAQVIIATYATGGRLLGTSMSSVDALEEVTLSSAEVAMIKVFVWGGIDGLTQISVAEKLEL